MIDRQKHTECSLEGRTPCSTPHTKSQKRMGSINMFPNRIEINCSVCGVLVPVGKGVSFPPWPNKGSVWVTKCAPCGGSVALKPKVNVVLDGGNVVFSPVSYLGGALFNEYRKATTGARYDKARRAQIAPLSRAATIVSQLSAAGFVVYLPPELIAAAKREDEALKASVEAAAVRASLVDEALAAKGSSLFAFRRQGIAWLSGRHTGLLGDDMGCVDGEAEIRVNRAKRGFVMKLSELYFKFNGGKSRQRSWNLEVPTYVRSLCDGVLRLHKIRGVLDQGIKPVFLLTLKSGKSLRLTGDHEVALSGNQWKRTDALIPGELVLTNGTPACSLCGSLENIAVKGSYPGRCRTCIYRYCRKSHKAQGGKAKDKSGYIRVPGNYNHPRANRAHQVLEHHLVMEASLGRYLEKSEVVHHKNGIKDDNRLENLELLEKGEHAKQHGKEEGFMHLHGGVGGKGGDVIFIPKEDSVVSVVPDGTTRVYDIICEDPHRNFVANGIVVHNCGKTLQTLASLPEGCGVVVICPAVAKGVWKRECAQWRPDLKVTVLSGRGNFRFPEKGEVIVTNYDILPDTFGKTPSNTVLVCDEAHVCKGGNKTARGKRVRALSKAVRNSNGRVWLLTATPMLNRPMELWSVLACAGLETEAFGSWSGFLRLFNGQPGDFGGFVFGKPLPEAAEALKKVILRRVKKDVLADLPAKRVQNLLVDIKESAAFRKMSEIAETVLGSEELSEQARVALLSEFQQKVGFEQIAKIRAELATLKMDAMFAEIENYEEAGEPLVVFSAHRAPIDSLATREGWAVITGDTSPEDRTRIQDAFQSGKLKGVGATIKAGGVAITLTNASNALFVDLEWTPALNEQAQDRIYRIGQNRAVLITQLVADTYLDRRITALLGTKTGLINSTVEAAKVSKDFVASLPSKAANLEAVVQAANEETERFEKAQAEANAIAEARAKEFAGRENEVKARTIVDRVAARKQNVLNFYKSVSTERRAATSPAENWAFDALRLLVDSDADRAREQNGIGFNKPDSHVGWELALVSSELGLTDSEWVQAVSLTKKYHKQVGSKCP